MSEKFRCFSVLAAVIVLIVQVGAGTTMYYNAPPNSNGIDAGVINFISAATSKLDIAIYSISHQGIVDAILAAKGRGVVVRMVTETDNWNASCDQLVAAGISVVKDNAGGGGSGLMHNKFIIRDGGAVLTGSYNFTQTQTTSDKNAIVIFTSSTGLANIYTTEFNKMFVSKKFGTAKTTTTVDSTYVSGVNVRVYFSPKTSVTTKLNTAIGTANYSVWFDIFTFTDQTIADKLIARKTAGVAVNGVFDRWQADGVYSKDEYLLNAGIPIRRDNYTGLLHEKLMAIDAGTTSAPVGIVGSFNFTGAANTTNDENTVFIYGSTVASSIKSNCSSVYNLSN